MSANVSTARATSPDVRPATMADREAVVRALVRSFDADPVARYLLRQDKHRARAYTDIFDIAFCKLTQPHGETWIAGDGDGTALWTMPNLFVFLFYRFVQNAAVRCLRRATHRHRGRVKQIDMVSLLQA